MRAPSLLLALAILAGATNPTGLRAQSGLFAPVVTVNGRAVTGYELDQRIRFLTLLRAPGDLRAQAEKGLIEDRLRLETAKAMKIEGKPEQLKTGMEEFAGSANLTLDQFIAAIGQAGVDAQTYRDFVEAGMAWREVISQKYGSRVVISPAEVQRNLSLEQGRGAGPRVLVSEILIPVRGNNLGAARKLADEIAPTLTSEAAFAAAARKYSAAASRDRGGKLDWIPLSNLPPQARGAMAQMGAGQVTPPIVLGDAVGFFRLQAIQPGGEVSARSITVDYALYGVPGGEAEAAQIRARAASCDDLYTVARGQPATRLSRSNSLLAQVPGDIAAALAGLDENESAVISRGGQPVLVMLCDRSATGIADSEAKSAAPSDPEAPQIVEGLGFGAGPSPASVSDELRNARLNLLSGAYMAELYADADIRRP